jgi:hypothetical protein
MTRRGVLTGAAAIAGVTALPEFLNRAGRIRIGHVVVDERLEASAAFAGGFDTPVLHAVSALDDLCNRWYTQLRRQLQADAASIAGLTTWMDYVIMRSCATEIGYARAFHAEHLPLGAAGLEHRVTGHPELLDRLLDQPHTWAQSMGRSLTAGAHLRSRFIPGQVFTATVAAAAAGHVRMVSWVFSPRSI